MARTVHASGTQTATINTEHVLEDETSSEGKVFDAAIDLAAMVAGDTTEIRVYAVLLASGTIHRVYYHKYVDVQDNEPILLSPIVNVPPLTVAKEWKVTLKQTTGTGRAYPWTVYSD